MSLFGSLSRLQKLYLANNGLDDAFFVPAPPNSGPIFPSLNQLDLSRNALDSLEHLEEVLKIPIERQAIYSGISTPTLLKAVSMPPPDAPRYQPLRIDLAGNFLREELPRRKQLRRAKRQDSCHDTEGTSISQNPEDTEPAAVLRLLDEVHQSITNRLREGQFGQDQLSTIKSLLELLQSATGVPKAEGPQAGISQVNTEQPAGQSLVNPLKESHPPLKSIMPEAAGSSRARRLRMQQEAQQWEPL